VTRLLLKLLLGCLLTACFADRPAASVQRSNLTLRKITRFEAPKRAQGSLALAPSDFVLSGGGLRVVVGGLERDTGRRGAILEAVCEGAPAAESIVQLTPTVYVGGVPRRVRIDRMFAVQRERDPVLRIEGSVWMQDRVISYAREMRIGRVPGTLSISTRLETLNPDGESDVRVGARIAWGGPSPFMPGVGRIEDASFHRGELIGAEGATASTTFGFADGSLSARGQYEEREHAQILLHTDIVSTQAQDLAAGKPLYVRSLLVVGVGGLSMTARALGFARGRPFPEAWAVLPYHPEGAEVRLTDGLSWLWMVGRPDAHGQVVIPLVPVERLLPKSLFLVASAYGHASSDVVSVAAVRGRAVTLRIPRGGYIRLRARDAVTSEPVPVRARLVPLEGTAPLALGPDHRASGARDTVVALRGEADIKLPSGRYHIILSHGPEWSMVEEDVEVTETYSPRVDVVLRHEVDPGDWIAADFHVHAEPSPDSEVTLLDRVASLEAEGIGFVTATDHNLITDYRPAIAEQRLDSMLAVPSAEVTTDLPIFGHFNAYPLVRDESRPGNGAPEYMGLEPSTLFRNLHALDPDLIVQVNHPRIEGGIGYFDVMSLDRETGAADPRFSGEFDAMEVFNGFDLARPQNVEVVFQDWLALLSRGQRVVATGASDSHQVRYQLVGYPRTYIRVTGTEGKDTRSVLRALKAGRAFVTSGPFLEASIGNAGPGATVSAPNGHVELSVRVTAPAWMPVEELEIFVGRERVIQRTIRGASNGKSNGKVGRVVPPRFEERFDLAIGKDDFVVVRVKSQTPIDAFFGRQGVIPMAFTNPIFVDADGDERTPWLPAQPSTPSQPVSP